jgi:hypothetical protein
MKSRIIAVLVGSLVCSGLFAVAHGADNAPQVDRVVMKDGKPTIRINGEAKALEKDLALTSSIMVLTNGSFTVNQGSPRVLQEGQEIRKDGMLISPNGSIASIEDHAIVKKGKVWIYKNGTGTPLKNEMTLPNGTRLSPTGQVRTAGGEFRRLIEGQMFKLTCEVLSSKDSVTMRGGKVYVQKEGTQFPLKHRQTIMMNDGTKVYGSGKLVKRDGTTQTVAESQIILLPGIRTNR